MGDTGLFTGHNTLRRHLYLMGLIASPLCSRCGAEEEISVHILCECEALASFFSDPEDVKEHKSGCHLEFQYRNRVHLT